MTAPPTVSVRCALCDTPAERPVATGVPAIGSPDLDTRPPGAARAALAYGVQRCAGCGHCAVDLSRALPGAAEAVRDPEYRAILADAGIPEVARAYLCRARLESLAGRLGDAFWSTLAAAWIADDAGAADAADRCRTLALAALRLARAAGRPPGARPGVDLAIEVDLLRRTGEFEQARRCILRALAGPLDEVPARVLRLQLDLVAERDRAAHPVSEALEGPG